MAYIAIASMVHAGFSSARPSSSVSVRPRRMVVVKAEAINPDIRKTEEKVVDSVVITELAKPLTAYCRKYGMIILCVHELIGLNFANLLGCWRSGTFPLCDGSHVKHNKATGDNVGPLLLKKQ